MPEAGVSLQGQVIAGKFQLGRYLGGTKNSAVFLTERPQGAPKTAAIKLMPADPATVDRRLTRWKAIAKFSHHHLLQIFETGRCEVDGVDALYVVMEYAEENLAQILPNRSLTPVEANDMLRPALQTLAYLHARGFVHGHLKPANIMVVDDHLKLSSDGICAIGERDGAERGIYGPPELSGTVVAPSRDIWSLGVTLVEVLTQLLPVWDGKGQLTLPEALPQQFVDLSRNCLERDPQRRCTVAEIVEHMRYSLPAPPLAPLTMPVPAPAGSAAAIAEAIVHEELDERSEQIKREEPVAQAAVARPTARPQAPERAQRPPQRRSYLVPVAAMVFTAALLIGGVKLFTRQPSQPAAAAAVLEVTPPSAPARTAGMERSSAQPPRSSPKTPAKSVTAKAQPPARATLKTASEVREVPPAPLVAPQAIPASGALAPGQVLQQVLPDVSRSSTNTIRGTVRVTVKVRVDPAGNVAGVNMVATGPSRYFAERAVEAAHNWKFSPARRAGQAVASAWTLRFEFIRGGVHVFPVPAL